MVIPCRSARFLFFICRTVEINSSSRPERAGAMTRFPIALLDQMVVMDLRLQD